MKSNKIIKRVDLLGRIYLPMTFRSLLDIPPGEAAQLAFFIDNNNLILTKYDVSCIFCGECKSLIIFEDKNICSNCIDKLISTI
ncbi:AbrB/MazE/SpoVT family DNA-binding domain-containing protein [Clostridium sardiniense]|uniref:AbrB/MazE/SpoVT family DNA-binding domain-containing protein n=1 Tax=Clostridium sardiniense TaxID=29369 RepID=UPI00195E5A66|nr:AbrB/MazE/SpoVT family DNA-binding domain-containing protein [Clostridium sardiniense]MBM7835568.1 transcriptional pleiotropic regulator of transition state genes [Clostridium sardiniense]